MQRLARQWCGGDEGIAMTLYAIRPESVIESLETAEVINESPDGWDFLEQAITLWRLVDPARAKQLEAILDRVTLEKGDEGPRFEADDLRETVRLLTGVEEAIVAAGIVDNHWRVPAERLEDLANQVPAMDLKTERPLENKTSALGEVMINAGSVRNFLSNAASEGCIVVLA